MKKIFALLMLLLSCCFALTKTEREAIFKSGFNTGLEMMLFQLKHEGVSVKLLMYPKDGYVVFLDTNTMPLSEILYLQFMANKEGYEAYMCKNELVFGYYEREADAKDAVKRIYSLFFVATKITESKSREFYIYPSVLLKAYNSFIAEAEKNSNYIYTDVINVNPPKKNNNRLQSFEITKYFKLKNALAQSYKNDKSSSKSIDFVEYKIMKDDKKYPLGRKVKTDRGEIFYQIKYKNIYFSVADVEEIK